MPLSWLTLAGKINLRRVSLLGETIWFRRAILTSTCQGWNRERVKGSPCTIQTARESVKIGVIGSRVPPSGLDISLLLGGVYFLLVE